MFNFVDDVRPTPAGVDFIQQRARRIVKPRRCGFLGLEVISFEAGPALQGIVVPGASGEIFVYVEVAVGNEYRGRRAPGR